MRLHLLLPVLFLGLFTSARPGICGPPAADDPGRYLRMSGNFLILYDSSTAMAAPYGDSGLTRLEMEKRIIRESHRTLPDLSWQAGLYPHWKGGLWLHGARDGFRPYYRLCNHEPDAFAAAIDRLPTIPTGPPMLQRAMMKLEHLLGLSGQTQVFLFTTGGDSRLEGVDEPDPVELARQLADRYDFCLTVVSSATSPEEKEVVARLGRINSCSQVMEFDTVAAHPEYLLGKLYMDGDTAFPNVLFDFDKSNIKKKYRPTLDRLGEFLKKRPDTYAMLSGFTDSIGTEAYNIGLSERRARSAQRYLRRKYGLPSGRLLLYWYGYSNPVATNATPEGRQLNRRVTINLRKSR